MITMQQFLLRQPQAPEEMPTDKYYLDLCNRLIEIAKEQNLFPSYPEKVTERAALLLIGYYQDVISDAGVWRAFINENRSLYGFTVPFYFSEEDYTDYELNRLDVKFMVWYAFSMNYENLRIRYPLDKELLDGAEIWFRELERVYDDSPIPEGYRLNHELEIHDKDDQQAIFHLGSWLFMHCYLMTPAYALTLSEIAQTCNMETNDGVLEFQKKLEHSMMKDPTGPLALFMGEWLYLMIEGKYPPIRKGEEPEGEHKYYTAFMKATKGKNIQYFGSYEEMNRFFIEALGWAENEEHLSQVKGEKDFVLMVDPKKGMLLARNVARCIASPDNPLYDKEYASNHAMDLLTERGCCPADLLIHICEKGWLPDAVFPGSDDHDLVKKNWDFIARCFLQQYYRGD